MNHPDVIYIALPLMNKRGACISILAWIGIFKTYKVITLGENDKYPMNCFIIILQVFRTGEDAVCRSRWDTVFVWLYML